MDGDTISFSLGEEFPFYYYGPTLKGQMEHDLSFLIHGMRIMEIGHFSFYMSFSGSLYHLISRQGDFNSGTWPKCCGMGMGHIVGRESLLGGGVVPITPFIERRFGPAPWVCALGLYMSFPTQSIYIYVIIYI